MLNKIKRTYYFLSNPQSLWLMAMTAIIFLVSWSSIKAIAANYELQKQIAILEQQNQLKELESKNLQLKNAYFNTDHYLELTARRVFGKAAPGEKLMLVPKEVALKHTVDKPVEKQDVRKKIAEKPWYQKNLEAWREFLF